MKKITLLLSFVACAMFTSAQLLLTENFSYNAGAIIGQGDWVIVGTSTTNPINVVASSISYTGYPGSGVGNEISLVNTGQDVTKTFSAQLTGTIYYSLIVNVSAAGSVGDYFIHLTETGSTSNFFGRLFVKSDNNKIAFGILNASGGSTYSVTYSPASYDLNTTYLIVVKTVVASGASSIVINPTISTTEPTTDWVVNTTGGTNVPAGDKGLGAINLRQGSSTADTAPTLKLDGIRVATSWAALFTTSGLNTPSVQKLEAIVSGKNLLVKNVVEGAEVEIFSAVGSKVQTSAVENGKVSIANLKGGMYVVRSGKLTQKIML